MKSILYWILACGICFAFGRYLSPSKIETKEVQVVKKDVEYITREIAKKDGTVIKEQIKKDSITKKDEKQVKVDNKKPNYKVGVTQYLNGKTAVNGEVRVLGPVFLGVTANTNGENLGVSLSMEF